MSLVATKLQDLRVKNPEFDRNMSRMEEYGALDFFVTQTDAPNSIISASTREALFSSIGRDVKIPVINYNSQVQVTPHRTCVISDSENTSALYAVQWQTMQVGFTMVPAAYMNNEIDYERDFAKKMNYVIAALARELDEAAVAALEANKTQVFKDLLNYETSGNVIDVEKQMATEILGDIKPMMRANAYNGQIHIVGNAGVESLINKLSEHGIYNDVNKRLEFEGKVFHYTNNVENESGYNGTFFAVEDGNVAVVTRVDREALRTAKANGHEWEIVTLPVINLPVGAHSYVAVGDQSGIAGEATADLNCGVKEYYGFSLDVAFIVAYNNSPSTIANPIIKAEIEALDTNQPLGMPVYLTNADEVGGA